VMCAGRMVRKKPGPDIREFVDPYSPVFDIASHSPFFIQENELVKDILHHMINTYRRLPVTNEKGSCAGILSSTDVLRALVRNRGMGRITSIMNRDVMAFTLFTTVKEALRAFHATRRGGFPVLARTRLRGMVTESDFVQQLTKPLKIPIGSVMSTKPFIIKQHYPVRDVAKILCTAGHRRLPVVEEEEVKGIITPSDILSFVYEMKERNVAGMEIPIGAMMNTRVISVSPEQDVYEAANIMKLRHIGGLPVIEREHLVGMITERDIVDLLRI
jgi:CBS domain-containing membrane protein